MSHLSEDQLDEIVAEERARDYEPLNDWRTIVARAREEGIIVGTEARGWSAGQPWMQAAAAILLLVGGVAIGRTTNSLPGSSQSESTPAVSTGVVSPVSRVEQPRSSATFASVDEASITLAQALADYQRASAYLAANNSEGATTTDSSRVYQNRLAALEKVGHAMESALQTAPHDPVINQYYLATMGARVATQQMVARPVSLALKGF
ncbi:MAG TPA: hypothetical protein VGD02_07480 [Gemmatimonadaceae bacterium]|jgi:hypothetical protein